jgi:integrase
MTFEFFLPRAGIQKTIYLSIKDEKQNKVFTLKTPLFITENNWDKIKQRPVNIYLKKFKRMNVKLDRMKKELSEYILEKRNAKELPKQRQISKKINTICSEEIEVLPENSLLKYMKWYIDSKKYILCKSTYKRYIVFFHLLERFEGFLCRKLYLEEVNSDFIKDFLAFGKEEEYSENTIYRTIHFVKTILNFAERKGVRTPVRELEVPREKQKKEIITLTENEIAQIEQTDVPKELQAAKDWLLISCYTGQRFSDFIHFDLNNLNLIKGKTCLSFVQQKTKKGMILPLHPKVLELINQKGGSFPPFLDNHLYNEQIKQVGKYANINDTIKARKRIGFRTKDVEIQKYEVLTSHIGRRSFATNFYGKIPTPLLMEATGHSTEQMFLKYINPANDERILALGDYFDSVYVGRVVV